MGGLGYVGFAEEVRAQEKQLRFGFDYIVVCTVTGSTQAGMVVGFARDGRQRNVIGIGIDASATPAQAKAQVLKIARHTATRVELGEEIDDDDVLLLKGYAYPSYGIPSEETKEAIRLCAQLEGMIIDPVYEGKSMQGMVDLVQKGFFQRDRRSSMRIWVALRRSTVTAISFATADVRRCCGARTRQVIALLHEGALVSLGNLEPTAAVTGRLQQIAYAEGFLCDAQRVHFTRLPNIVVFNDSTIT